MPNTVTLENLTRRAKVVILDHPAFRDKKWGFQRVAQLSLQQQADGSVVRTNIRRSLIGSIVLPAKGKVSGLHPAIAKCSQVEPWLAKGEVRIKKDAAPAEPKKRGRGRSTSDNGDSA